MAFLPTNPLGGGKARKKTDGRLTEGGEKEGRRTSSSASVEGKRGKTGAPLSQQKSTGLKGGGSSHLRRKKEKTRGEKEYFYS